MYLDLFWAFFKIGLFTFGGGYAMLPLIQSEVLSRQWMTAEEIVNFIAVSESTPGPFAVNIATYVGMVTAGLAGAVCCTLGVALPSFLIILLISGSYQRFRKSRLVEGAMGGLRPAVIGLIASALLSIGKGVFFPSGSLIFPPAFFVSAALFLVILVLALKKKHPVMLIGLSAAVGIAAGYLLNL